MKAAVKEAKSKEAKSKEAGTKEAAAKEAGTKGPKNTTASKAQPNAAQERTEAPKDRKGR